jgi:hypothetical protein
MYWHAITAIEMKTAPAKRKPAYMQERLVRVSHCRPRETPGNGQLVDAATTPTSWSDAETRTPE